MLGWMRRWWWHASSGIVVVVVGFQAGQFGNGQLLMIVHWRRHISKIFRRWQKVVYLVRIVEFGLCRRLLIPAAPAPTSTKVMVRTDIVLLLMLAMMISGA